MMDAEMVIRFLSMVRDLRVDYPWAEDAVVLLGSAWVCAFTLAKMLQGGKWCGANGCRGAAKVWRFVYPASPPYEPSPLAEKIIRRLRYASELRDQSPSGHSGTYVSGFGIMVQAGAGATPSVWVKTVDKPESWKYASNSLTAADKNYICNLANDRLAWIVREKADKERDDLVSALT